MGIAPQANTNEPPPPIGVIHTAWGGSTIEQWPVVTGHGAISGQMHNNAMALLVYSLKPEA